MVKNSTRTHARTHAHTNGYREKKKRKEGMTSSNKPVQTIGFATHLEGKTRADGNDEGTTERSEQEKQRGFWVQMLVKMEIADNRSNHLRCGKLF